MKRAFIILTALALALLPLQCPAEGAAETGKPFGTVLPIVEREDITREAFFANGTAITINAPTADVSGWTHDAEVQTGLGNGLSPSRKPSPGAVISWADGEETRYVYVTGNSKVFGGGLNTDVKGDVRITVAGTDGRKDFPNVSFLFGGGYGGNVDGNVAITLEESQMMYVYGGGYNGSVTGDVRISTAGQNWFLDLVGGGLASSKTGDAVADVSGNIVLDMKGTAISYTDTITCGGLAESISEYATQANVGGNITVYAEGRNVYQLCGGGEAFRVKDDFGQPTANVAGSITLEIRGSRMRYYEEGSTALLGGVVGGGMAYCGIATVGGDLEITVGSTDFDRNSIGVVLGGMAQGEGAAADVEGSAVGRVVDGANPERVVRGGIEDDGSSAETRGGAAYFYTLTDGLGAY